MSRRPQRETATRFLPLLDVPQASRYPEPSQSPEPRRLSADTTSTTSHAYGFRIADSGISSHPAPARILTEAPPGRASSPRAGWMTPTQSRCYGSPNMGCHSTHAGKYAYERNRFIEAGEEIMATIEYTGPSDERANLKHDHLDRMKDAWRSIRHHNHELNQLETLHNDLYTSDDTWHFSNGIHSDTHAERPHICMSVYTNRKRTSDVSEADYAELYYENASAAKWLSDDLINLGPRPRDDLAAQYDEADDEYPTEELSPLEWAKAHLQIIRELRARRRDAAMYKRICLERGIALDDDTNDDAVSQDDDVYQYLLDRLEYGPSRIDSVIAVNHNQQAHRFGSSDSTTDPLQQVSRVAAWADEVESQIDPNEDESIVDAEARAPPIFTFTECDKSSSPKSANGSGVIHSGCNGPNRRHIRSHSSTFPMRASSPLAEQRLRWSSSDALRQDVQIDFPYHGLACTNVAVC